MASQTDNAPSQIDAASPTQEAAKICTACQLEKPATDFGQRKLKGQVVPRDICEACRLSKRQENQEKRRQRREARQESNDACSPVVVLRTVVKKPRGPRRGKEPKVVRVKYPRVPDGTLVTCVQCKLNQLASSFATDVYAENGIKTICRMCSKVRSPTEPPTLDVFFDYLLKMTAKHNRKAPFNLTRQDLQALYDKQQGKCARTGLQMTTSMKQNSVNTMSMRNVGISMDDPVKGYVNGNVSLVCAGILLMESKFTKQDLEKFAQAFFCCGQC